MNREEEEDLLRDRERYRKIIGLLRTQLEMMTRTLEGMLETDLKSARKLLDKTYDEFNEITNWEQYEDDIEL